MDNIAPVRALSRRSTQLVQLGFIVLAVGIFITIVSTVIGTIQLIPPSHPLYQLYLLVANLAFALGLIVAAVGVGIFIRAFTRRRENDLALQTGNLLAEQFDGRHSFIRNINRPGLGYIDAVLIGPPGALVFRIVNEEGNLANEAANWLKQNPQGEWLPFTNLTREAVDDIQHLRQYLAKNNLGDVPVFGVIVFTRDESRAQVAQKEPVVPISHAHNLYENLHRDYLSKPERIPQQVVTGIRRLLLEG